MHAALDIALMFCVGSIQSLTVMTIGKCQSHNPALARLAGESVFLGEEMFATRYFKVERKLFTGRLTLITIRRAQKNDKVVSAAGFCIAQEAVQAA
ncbi:hypothetical protein [Chromobacterium sp. CV08]|uniref:hypothetical protein n=1 Tax=Chromobacterium sp. CV08 TaxID=3133274 RepID=UPI003DA7E57F